MAVRRWRRGVRPALSRAPAMPRWTRLLAADAISRHVRWRRRLGIAGTRTNVDSSTFARLKHESAGARRSPIDRGRAVHGGARGADHQVLGAVQWSRPVRDRVRGASPTGPHSRSSATDGRPVRSNQPFHQRHHQSGGSSGARRADRAGQLRGRPPRHLGPHHRTGGRAHRSRSARAPGRRGGMVHRSTRAGPAGGADRRATSRPRCCPPARCCRRLPARCLRSRAISAP